MSFVNLYFGLKLLPIIIFGICIVIFILWVAWILMVEKIKDIKNNIVNKFKRNK